MLRSQHESWPRGKPVFSERHPDFAEREGLLPEEEVLARELNYIHALDAFDRELGNPISDRLLGQTLGPKDRDSTSAK